MTLDQPHPHMPAIESLTSLLVATIGASALTLLVGNEAASAAADAAATALQVQQMTDVAVIGYSLFWGLMGGVVSWSFKLLPRDLAEGGRQILGSALTAGIAAPAIIVYYHFPQTIIPIATIAGTTGILASAVIIKVVPLLANLLPAWMLNLFRAKGINTDEYDMSNGRPHSPRHAKPTDKTEKIPTLHSGERPHPRRRHLESDDSSNAA